ncbi:F-box/kelch-repeat protein At3g06240-like [Cornus florida]|uniref:F-box/kelch-repeat protein At3g06240-like n=1 Tax=Cornus florida TaxID=4283 RepID=UPI00289F4BD9|nr:F-box/kelch-repeat protein At3g06240-like [Cornus florida]
MSMKDGEEETEGAAMSMKANKRLQTVKKGEVESAAMWTRTKKSKEIVMSYLPDHVVVGILLNLPVKSLLRFKCVSKAWRSLISEPDFIKAHLDFQRRYERLLMNSSLGHCLYSINLEPRIINDIEAIKISDIPDMESKWFQIIGSCNGLLCISTSHTHLYIVNPSTRVSKKVPDHPGLKLFAIQGFGYDHTVDDYKLLNGDQDDFHMYSLKTNSWKKVESCFPRSSIVRRYGTSLNGAIHWVCNEHDTNQHQQYSYVIVAFSLADEKFSKIALPIQGLVDVGVFRGCLCMSRRRPNGEFWVMKKYGVTQSWTNVAIETLPFRIESLVLTNNDELLKNDELLFRTGSKKFVLYNIREKTGRDLILPDTTIVGTEIKVGGYVESLVSPIMGV